MAAARTSSDNLWSKLSCARSTPMIALRFHFAKTRFQKETSKWKRTKNPTPGFSSRSWILQTWSFSKSFCEKGRTKLKPACQPKKRIISHMNFLFAITQPLSTQKNAPMLEHNPEPTQGFHLLASVSPVGSDPTWLLHNRSKLKAKMATEAASCDQKLP